MAQQSNFGYRRHADQDRTGNEAAQYPVVAVGAGPVGLSFAIDLAQRGQPVVLLDDADRIGEGSRAIMFSKRSLEYWDRLGVGNRMVGKGVEWSVGKIFHGASLLYQFNLLPEGGTSDPPSSTSSNSMPKPIWWIGYRSLLRSTCAGATR
jgi:3-(3-hydroxy-phenyl)propionate hydroxylase